MSEWDESTIDQIKADTPNAIAMGPFGSRIKTDNFVSVGVPVIRGKNLNAERLFDDDFVYLTEEKADELRASNAFPGDIVITHRGTLGQVGIVPYNANYPRYVVSQSQMKLTVNKQKADPFFVFYFLRSPQGQHALLSNTSQTGVPAIAQPTTSLKAINIPLPPLPEQRAIAHILGTLDDKIELNRRMNETLEAMARAIFKSWFVDFDPVSAKAEGLDTGLPEEIADLFPDSFEDSELGEVPKGWKVATLSELCTLGRGASPRPINDFMNGEVPWIKIADATTANGPFLFETKEKIKLEGVSKSVSVFPGDLILSNSATCGIPIFVEINGCIHDGWLYFKNLQLISKLYLYHVLIELSEHLINIADGSVQKNLNTNLVGKQPVLVPPEFLMDAFDQQASVIFGKIQLLCLESRTFAELRDTLLPKLILGELRVNEAEHLCRRV